MIQRQEPTSAADIYSFGVVVYHAMTGVWKLPSVDMIGPSRHIRGLPRSVDRAVCSCFNEAENRPKRASYVAAKVRSGVEEWARPRRWWLWATLGGLVGGGGLAGVLAVVVLIVFALLSCGGLVICVGFVGAMFLDSLANQNAVAGGDQLDSGFHGNPLDIQWVRIPGGTFQMGSTERSWEEQDPDEQPVRDVSVVEFEMSRTEVTVSQYEACVEAGVCTEPDTDEGCNWRESQAASHPVNCLDWSQSRQFATWIGGRLPSEAEWEYAARGGESHEYAGSPNPDTVACWNNAGNGTCDVGSTRANGYGLVDMSGNVEEWVEDCYGEYREAPSDGSPDTSCTTSFGVARGGGWQADFPEFLRVANRNPVPQEYKSKLRGFRVARDVQ